MCFCVCVFVFVCLLHCPLSLRPKEVLLLLYECVSEKIYEIKFMVVKIFEIFGENQNQDQTFIEFRAIRGSEGCSTNVCLNACAKRHHFNYISLNFR